jgi:hypothetical protein
MDGCSTNELRRAFIPRIRVFELRLENQRESGRRIHRQLGSTSRDREIICRTTCINPERRGFS